MFEHVQTILDMIKKSRGSLVTFNAKKIAVLANIETQPVILTLVKDVLEKLRERGCLEVLGKTKHGTKYAVKKGSPLWVLAKNYDRIVLRSLEDLNLLLEKIPVTL